MSLWVVIPVKPLNRAKSRLASVLAPQQRYELAEMMLRQVLAVVSDVPHITGTLVISRDTKALAIAREMGAKTIQESSPSELNPALVRATEVLRMWRAKSIMILPADLPFIRPADVTNMIEMADHTSPPCVVIATDRNRDGTNAMIIKPPGLFDYDYGVGSFQRHVDAAQRAGALVKYYESPTLSLDIDESTDLDEYNFRVGGGEFRLLIPFLPDATPE